tara:strand:+ start:1303 stop:1500 length:198 start_codon:yes stop_codon:yes gene_type:complete
MTTVKESMAKIAAHEKECAIRYSNIEKRLDKGDAKFDVMDAKFTRYIVGLYILIIAASGVDRIFS